MEENHLMENEKKDRKINWYRSPVDRALLNQLNQRSDWLGLAQTLGHLGLLALTGGLAIYAAGRASWAVVLLLLFLHGTFYAFLLNAFHELCHKTVFKSKFLNTFFLQLISFLSWHNPVMFWASHQEHHKFTLYPPDELEVVLPQKLSLRSFLQNALVNPWDFYYRFRLNFLAALGKVEGEWETHLFPESNVQGRRRLAAFGRCLLLGQAAIVLVSLYFGWWMVPVVITLAPFYGGWLQYLCNNTQHAGLMDRSPDYRLCTRTISLPPFIQFLYWHMNFHIEHHMYAAVPCYRLGRLHAAIQKDLPPTQNLIGAWKEIIAILRKQKQNPKYQYMAELPVRTLQAENLTD